MKLTAEEQIFQKEYVRMENFEREKGIKFFECIGDEPTTELFEQ
jgi:hypothetical protein